MKVKKGKIITITSAKGGIGKTIFATNLAGVYHYNKKKTLIMDLDLYAGGISVILNSQNKKTIYNLVDDIMNNRFQDALDYVSKYSEYVDVLSTCRDPRQGGKIEAKFIEQIIQIYHNRYDVIIIDTTHIQVPPTLVAMDMADTVLYMVSNDPIDLANSKSNMAIFRDIEKKNIKVVLNNSFNPDKKYFSNFDIRSVLKHNIDYVLEESMFIPGIDRYLMEGKILVLNDNLSFKKEKDRAFLIKLAEDLCEDDENE